MHVTEREALILEIVNSRGFVSFRDLESIIEGSPATIRRDLERLSESGQIDRIRGGARAIKDSSSPEPTMRLELMGSTFRENSQQNRKEKRAIAKAAAELCEYGEAVTIDGGSTTYEMCSHLSGLHLQVLTNSLHIVLGLIEQPNTNVLMPGGAVFPEQNIVLPLFGEDLLPKFHAPKLFMGAGAIGKQGLMQEDVVLVAGERRFIERASEVIILADASKFERPSGNVVCDLSQISKLVTDSRIDASHVAFLEDSGIDVIIAPD